MVSTILVLIQLINSLLSLVNRYYGLEKDVIPDNQTVIDRSLCSSNLKEILKFPIPSWDELVHKMHDDYLDLVDMREKVNE